MKSSYPESLIIQNITVWNSVNMKGLEMPVMREVLYTPIIEGYIALTLQVALNPHLGLLTYSEHLNTNSKKK